MPQRDKSQKFVELANKRVNRAIKELRLVGNLGNRNNYTYSDEQAKTIIKALQHVLDETKQCFQAVATESRNEFKL